MSVTSKPTQRTFGDRTWSEWAIGLVSTAVICALIAALTQLMNGASYWLNLRISLGFGIAMVLTINLSHLAWPERSDLFRNSIGVIVGLSIGMINLLMVVFGNPFKIDFREHWAMILGNLGMSALFSLIVFYFFYTTYRVQRLHREVSEHQLQAARKDKDLMHSRLKLMQSQIEPHFLFNTLANVQGLIDQDSAAAKRLVGELTTMLRASLRRTRQEYTRLSEELTIVRSYLAIQSIRMGDRLAFSVESPDALDDRPLPPLLIQPLVENAVVHGIEPCGDGGRIDVSVREEAGRLTIRVSDTGMGLERAPTSSGEGVGLSNVRDRLRLLYGDEASLMLKPGVERGTEVCLLLPLTEEVPTDDD